MTDLAPAATGLSAALIAASPDGVFALDRELRVTAWNPAMERLSGVPAAAALGRAVREVLPWLDELGGAELARRALAGEEPVSPDWLFGAGSGRSAWVEARWAPLRDPAGEVVGALAVLRDVTERRRRAEESEERFRTLADTAPVMIWLADTRNLGTYFSRPWLEFTGRALEEELGAGWVESVHPDDRRRAAAYCQERFDRREEFRMEFRMRRRDGEWRWVLDHGIPRWGAGGEFLGYVGSCVDITDRRRAEEALRHSEERYRSLVEASTQMVWLTDAEGMVDDMPFWRQLTGQTPEEVRGAGWAAAVHPDDRERVLAAWWRACEAKGVYEAEYRLRMRDGGYRWFSARGVPVLDPDGGIREWVGLFNDVHARKAAEAAAAEARREAEARAAEAARLAGELAEQAAALRREVEESEMLTEELVAINRELTAASARAEEGRRRLQVLASASGRLAASLDYRETVQTVARLVAPELADWCFVEVQEEPGGPIRMLAAAHADPAMVELAFEILGRYPIRPGDPHGTARVLRTGEPEVVPDIPPEFFELLGHDDEHRRLLARVGFRSAISVPLAVAGRTFGVLSLVQAESGRRLGEADLPLAQELAHRAAVAIENARLYQEALAANRAKAGFLATMSHELRTPLNAMIGYVDLLLLGIPEPLGEGARAQVERIRLASRHLLSIIEEILTFSRVEAGRETVEAEEVDLAALVGEVSAIIEPLAAARGIAFRAPERLDPPTLATDPRKLRQILVNLLGNAVKFTREGTVSFEVEREGGQVLLHVRDTGIGVEPRLHEAIFEPFLQVDDAKTRSAPGTGLGLAVSRRLARLLGGDITVASAPGEGSTFTVRLPGGSA